MTKPSGRNIPGPTPLSVSVLRSQKGSDRSGRLREIDATQKEGQNSSTDTGCNRSRTERTPTIAPLFKTPRWRVW